MNASVTAQHGAGEEDHRVDKNRLLPKISASRPATGIATALPSNVAVSGRELFAGRPCVCSSQIEIIRNCVGAAHRLESRARAPPVADAPPGQRWPARRPGSDPFRILPKSTVNRQVKATMKAGLLLLRNQTRDNGPFRFSPPLRGY